MRAVYAFTLAMHTAISFAATPAQIREMNIITKCGMVASVSAMVYQDRSNEAKIKQHVGNLYLALKTLEPIEPNIDELAVSTAFRMLESVSSSFAPNPIPRDVVIASTSAICALELTRRSGNSAEIAKDFYSPKK